jgi:hypothetical protein
MQRYKKIIIYKHGTTMKHKYLTNFMMFTDLVIQPTQLVTFTGNRYTCLCSLSFSLYSHFKNIFLRLYVISVTLVENFKAVRLSNKKNAGSTKAALETMCTNSTKDSILVVKCMTFVQSVQWVMDLRFCIITYKEIGLLHFVRLIMENSVCTWTNVVTCGVHDTNL